MRNSDEFFIQKQIRQLCEDCVSGDLKDCQQHYALQRGA